MKPSIEANFAAFIGIDWADAKYDVSAAKRVRRYG
jgi:hypothetical protein